MKLTPFVVPMLLALTACPGSDSPGGNETDSSSSGTGDSSASTDASVTLTTTTQGSMSNTGMTMTEPTTDPTTTTEPTTTDPTDASETTDPTGTETTEPTTTEPADGSSSTGEPPGPVTYDACDLEARPDMQCAIEGESCFTIPSFNPLDPVRHWCSIPCEMGEPDNCPEPSSGDATVECSGVQGTPCALSCADGETCPDGMVCFDAMINNVMRCVWESEM